MEQRDDDAFSAIAIRMEQSIRQSCQACGRGAVNLAQPSIDDLDALLSIKAGFDRVRRDFSPEMERRLQSLEKVAHYLHTMIAGGRQ